MSTEIYPSEPPESNPDVDFPLLAAENDWNNNGPSPSPVSTWRMIRIKFCKYGPFGVHFGLTALIATVCLCFLDGRTFNTNSRRPQYVEADGSFSHSKSYAPLQSDITTAVSLAASATRVAAGWWATGLVWRSIFVAMEQGGIFAEGLSQVASSRPPAYCHIIQKSNVVIIYIILVATFAIDYFSAALTGSLVWEPASTLMPGRVALTGITRGVSGIDISGYFNHKPNRTLVVEVGSAAAIVAWGSHPPDFLNGAEPSTVFRRVIKGAQYISINSTLNTTMPYFDLVAFEWVLDPAQVLTEKQLPLFHDDSEFSPYSADVGVGGLLPDSYWGPSESVMGRKLGDSHNVSETRLFIFRVGRYDSDVWPCPQNYTIDPGFQVNLHGYRFQGYYTDCFAIAKMTYRAGAITCQSRNCRLISSTIVEAQPPFSLVGDPLTSMALALAPLLCTNFFFSNYAVPSNYGTRRNLAIELTSRAYQAAWAALSNVLISESDDATVEIALPTLRTKVIRWRIYLWVALHLLVLVLGLLFIYVQSHCNHPWVEDLAMAIFWLDTRAGLANLPGGQCVVSDPWQPGMEIRNEGVLILRLDEAGKRSVQQAASVQVTANEASTDSVYELQHTPQGPNRVSDT
ncbi:uncharacterized protein LACBIDRAFT_312970 [Laccaria bicolor S238N-H82]|uniref:Predicted protein n=1 Tax=Laccaria bicolor (strain S238N-H82 / ATCC MYA-4686) TaxID=486041 RepID=B0DX82_LACBS|nr:uncharacterized protein LACBIDRAFT_312970 [Laccaria bicolor S238N-H82]EDR00790.1 predicted protein [Laccaria bicolor S238N-H82]|eukprot:XP_001888582.1 predicted protein [Laccaria bicolor S238N-H82]